MLSKDQLKQYNEKGYFILEILFSVDEMTELRTRIDHFDAESEKELMTGGQSFNRIPNQINFTVMLNQKDPYIRNFACQDKFVNITTSILGPDVMLYFDQSVYKRPEANRDFPWHQDNGYIPIDPEHYITCWLALEDATVENGTIWVLPETHKQGVVEHEKTEIGYQCYFGDDPGIPVSLTKGSMAVFSSLLFHRSTPNLSSSTRKGYILQYAPSYAKHGVTGEPFHNGPVIAQGGKSVYVPSQVV